MAITKRLFGLRGEFGKKYVKVIRGSGNPFDMLLVLAPGPFGDDMDCPAKPAIHHVIVFDTGDMSSAVEE